MAAPKAPYLGKTGKVDLDAVAFGEEFHMSLVHETVRAELNARRRGTASTRTRGEVAMTTAKAFRQKGTGRARAGALSTPQRTGGGVAFGPKPRGYKVKVNRKARRRALRAALTMHAERGTIAVVDAGDFDAPSTRTAAEGLAKFGEGHALVVLARDGEENAVKSFRNLPGVTVLPSDNVAVADIVRAARLVVSPSSLERLTAIAQPPVASSHTERDRAAKQEASA